METKITRAKELKGNFMKTFILALALIITAGCGGQFTDPNFNLSDSTAVVIPANFPQFEVRTSKPQKMEPGLILFAIQDEETGNSYLVKIKPDGEIFSVLEVPYSVGDLRIDKGQYLFIGDEERVVLMDPDGTVAKEFASMLEEEPGDATLVNTERFHHEVSKTSDGNYLVLGRKERELVGYPNSDTEPGASTQTAVLAEDVIIEFDEQGNILNEHHLFDILDPYRIGYDSLNHINGVPFDWTHSNAVIHDPSDDSFIVSARHQDAVVKIDRYSGEIIWILGNPNNWTEEFQQYLLTPIGDNFAWQYHQHAPQITPNGLLIYDNGNYRASPFDGSPKPSARTYSRAVEYKIDPDNMTVEQIWEFDADEKIFTPFIGDADRQPNTGNTLITFGGIIDDGRENARGRIMEVTSEGEVVFDLEIKKAAPEQQGWIVYRSEKVGF